MKTLKYIGIGAITLVLLFFLFTLMIPSTYYVERSITVEASQDDVYEQVAELKNWKNWSPWQQKFGDAMKVSYGDVTDEEGGYYSWTGEESGNGKMTITNIYDKDSVAYDLTFEGMEPSIVLFKINKASTDNTEVTWVMKGDVGGDPMGKVFALMMDSFLGPDYEQGLANLKEVVEK